MRLCAPKETHLCRCQTKHPSPSCYQRLFTTHLNKEERREYQALSQVIVRCCLIPPHPQYRPICFHTLGCCESCAEGHQGYPVETFSHSVWYCLGFLHELIKWSPCQLLLRPAFVMFVFIKCFFPLSMSPQSKPAIRRVALCQTHTDCSSAQNQLTCDLLAIIHILLPLSHNLLWHLCGPWELNTVSNFP